MTFYSMPEEVCDVVVCLLLASLRARRSKPRRLCMQVGTREVAEGGERRRGRLVMVRPPSLTLSIRQ